MTKQPNALEAARELIEGKPISNPNVTVQELCRVYLAAEARIRVLEEAVRWCATVHAMPEQYMQVAASALAKEETPT